MSFSLTPASGEELLSPPVGTQLAIAQISKYDGVTVSVVDKAKAIHKFGQDPSAGVTRSTVDGLADATEILLTTNGITSIVSSSAADATETIYVEGHTISGDDLTFVSQTVTLNGQTAVTLGTALARVSRMNNTSGTELAGAVSAYEGGAITAGVPDTSTEIHASIRAGEQQTEKAATSTSSVDYLFITHLAGSIHDASNLECDIALETKATNGVWRHKADFAVTVAGNPSVFQSYNDSPIVVPPNHDIRMLSTMASGTAKVTARFGGWLGIVV